MSRAPWLWCPVSFDLDSPLRSGFGLTVCVLTCFMTVGLSRISLKELVVIDCSFDRRSVGSGGLFCSISRGYIVVRGHC